MNVYPWTHTVKFSSTDFYRAVIDDEMTLQHKESDKKTETHTDNTRRLAATKCKTLMTGDAVGSDKYYLLHHAAQQQNGVCCRARKLQTPI